jgi:membrane-associated phospholipid phosphatase
MMRKFTTFILFLLGFVILSNTLPAQNTDIVLLKQINHAAPALKPTSVVLTESALYISLAAPVAIAGYGLIRSDQDLLKDACYIALASGANVVATDVLKRIFNRPRPGVSYPEEIEAYKVLKSRSMPSSHTSCSFVTATALSLKYPKWYVIVPAYTWATAIGVTRMHLGVHYPSDVLAGAALGIGSAYLTYKLNEWWWNHYDIKAWRIVKKKQEAINLL